MRRRWSVAGQLLALQLGIIAVVLLGVGGVSLAQAQIDFRRTEGARALSAAENLAARPVLRQALVSPSRPARTDQAAPIADGVQSLSGVSFVEIADADGVVFAKGLCGYTSALLRTHRGRRTAELPHGARRTPAAARRRGPPRRCPRRHRQWQGARHGLA